MPTPTYIAIQKTVLTSNQASVTLRAIPSTFTDLLLTISARDTGSSGYVIIRANSINSGYSEVDIRGDGVSATGISATGDAQFFAQGYLRIPNSSSTSNTFSNQEIYFPMYAGTTQKIASANSVNESNASTVEFITLGSALLTNTAAISSLLLTCATSFASGSRFDLYGIKNS